MPKKALLGVLAVLVAALLIVNGYVAGIVEGEIEDQLDRLTSQLPQTVSISYSGPSVTPIFARASLENVELGDRAAGMGVRCDRITVGCPYGDAIALARRKEIEEIHGLDIDVKGLEAEDDRGGERMTVRDLAVHFDGRIARKDFELGPGSPPLAEDSRHLEISIRDLKVDDPDLLRETGLTADEGEKITTIDRASLRLRYDPEAKELRVDRLTLRTPIGSMDLSGGLRFRGDSLSNLHPEAVEVDMDGELTPSGIRLGDPRKSGRYGLDELKVESSLVFDIGGPVPLDIPLPGGTASLTVRGLSARSSGKLTRELETSLAGWLGHMPMDEITVDRFSAHYAYENGRLVLSDVELITGFLKAFLDVEIDVDESHPDDSAIRTARLTLRDVSDDAMGALVSLEEMAGTSFRSDEREYVIEVSGTIGNPVFKSEGEGGSAPAPAWSSGTTGERKREEHPSGETKGLRRPRETGETGPGPSPSAQGAEASPPQETTGARITSVEPPRLIAGRRTAVVLSGTGLDGATAVTIDRTATIENPPQVSPDGSRITVYVTIPPDQSAGRAVVSVYTPRGNQQAEVTIAELPSIESVDPPQLQPGNRTQVTIRGRNLEGAMAVTTDRAAVVENPPAVSPDGTRLAVYITLSEGQVGASATLTVLTPRGSATGTIALAQEAELVSVEPQQLVLGRRSVVALTGKNLQGTSEVTIDRQAAIENPPSVDEEGGRLKVAVRVPVEQRPGPATLTIHGPQGSPTIGITLVRPPEITSVEPERIVPGGKETLTLRGTDLHGASAVSMDREAAIDNPPRVNPEGTELTVSLTVPEGQTPGAATITVHTERGDASAGIVLLERAEVGSARPSKVTLGERTPITLRGKNLDGATKVSLDRSAVIDNPPRVNADGTEVSFSLTVPEGQKAGAATLTVHTPRGDPTTKVTLIEPPWGALYIDASMRGGECFIDGKGIGTKTVPNYVKLSPGHHTIRIVQPGCSPGAFEYDAEVIVDQEVRKFFELDCR